MIREQEIRRGEIAMVEVMRDGVDTVYLLKPHDAAECSRIQHEGARWRCVKAAAFFQRKKRPEEE